MIPTVLYGTVRSQLPEEAPVITDTTALPTEPIVQRRDDAPTYATAPGPPRRCVFSSPARSVSPSSTRNGRPAWTDHPLHRHPWASWEYLVEGELRVVIDEEEFHVSSGDFLYTPPSAAHTYVVESDIARIVGFNHPGGHFEDLNREVAPMFLEPGGPDMEVVVRSAAEHGVEILGPPLGAAS
ncbi:MAG: cupin domain-containing protein [Acidimicrobiales bacterium]|nr:cupin domain-containing protein [Acidimicrobiales bacterium]